MKISKQDFQQFYLTIQPLHVGCRKFMDPHSVQTPLLTWRFRQDWSYSHSYCSILLSFPSYLLIEGILVNGSGTGEIFFPFWLASSMIVINSDQCCFPIVPIFPMEFAPNALFLVGFKLPSQVVRVIHIVGECLRGFQLLVKLLSHWIVGVRTWIHLAEVFSKHLLHKQQMSSNQSRGRGLSHILVFPTLRKHQLMRNASTQFCYFPY